MSATSVTARAGERDLAPLHRPNKRWTRFILPGFTWLMIVYLASPIFVMILYSFNDVPIVPVKQTPKFWGFTLRWWRDPFGVPGMPEALRVSLQVAPLSAIVATALGTLLGLALGRYRFRGKAPVNFLIFIAIAVPEIVLGSSLLALFIKWPELPLVGAFAPPIGFPTILLSHISFSIAFVAVTVRARVQTLDRSLEDAAQDLFADPVTTFFKVTLPLIAPSILAGFLLASTSEVYGDPLVHPQPEDYRGNVNPVGPRSVYDEAKRYAEALTVAYARAKGVPVKIARIFNTYGPRMRADDGRAIPTFIRQALTGRPITVHGDGSQTRTLCYVDDLVEGIRLLLGSDLAGPVNLGGAPGHPLSYRAAGTPPRKKRLPHITHSALAAQDRIGNFQVRALLALTAVAQKRETRSGGGAGRNVAGANQLLKFPALPLLSIQHACACPCH